MKNVVFWPCLIKNLSSMIVLSEEKVSEKKICEKKVSEKKIVP